MDFNNVISITIGDMQVQVKNIMLNGKIVWESQK